MLKEHISDYTVYSQDLKLLNICTYPPQAQGNHDSTDSTYHIQISTQMG